MRLFPKDRDLSLPLERADIPVRASDFQLKPEELNMRLDAFLQHFLHWRSRTSIQRLIHDGYVLVCPARPDRPAGSDEKVEKRPGRKLVHGARVVVVIPDEHRLELPSGEPGKLRVLFENEHVMAVDKPPMESVHPGGRHLTGTLIQRVHAYDRERYGDNKHYAKLCHRLDRETSGVVLIAKQDTSHRFLMREFEERRVTKEYLAIVIGSPELDQGVVDLPLGPARASRVGLKMACVPDGLPSRTEWRVIERFERCTLVACHPLTGRQHQIRVHMDAIGHPLVGDKLYGLDETYFLREAERGLSAKELAELGMPRQALHNHRLVIASPDGTGRIDVSSPLAEDMRKFLQTQASLGGSAL